LVAAFVELLLHNLSELGIPAGLLFEIWLYYDQLFVIGFQYTLRYHYFWNE